MFRRHWAAAPGRRLTWYLAAVVGPTLVLLMLGILAARREHDALEASTLTARRLLEARIADKIERALLETAAEVFADHEFTAIVQLLEEDAPETHDAAASRLAAIRERLPIVRDLFVVGADGISYPRTNPPLPRLLDEWIAAEPAGQADLRALLDRAEGALHRGDGQAAAKAFTTAEARAATRRVRAHAAAGVARAARVAGDTGQALAAWRSVATLYADTYSLAGRPLALVAASELAESGRGGNVLVGTMLRDLLEGHWSLTPEQADHFARRLGGDPPPATTPFGKHLDLARALRTSFGVPVIAAAGRVHTAVIPAAGGPEQLCFTRDPASARVAGFAVDLEWTRRALVPAVAKEVSPGAMVAIGPSVDSDHAAFRTVLPFWSVRVAPDERAVTWFRSDLLLFMVGVFVVLAVLMGGVIVLTREVARESDLNRMRADLVGGVSHELKAPLSVVRVCAEAIHDVDDATGAERQHFAAAIVQETERLGRLIDDVIDFSRIQQGQRVYNLQAGSVAEAVTSATSRFRPYAELHGFSLEAVLDGGVGPIACDAVAVEQAVLNLLDNAVKYAGDSREIRLRLVPAPDGAVIEVEDHGLGIAADEQPHIFERFRRGVHRDRGGYGLGLYLVRHVMTAHGGHVDVESTAGCGSIFRLHFSSRVVPSHAQTAAG